MVSLRLYLPAPDMRAAISAYYILDIGPAPMTDLLPAEQANIRFALSGDFDMRFDGDTENRAAASPPAFLFGQRTRPVIMQARGPARVFGIGVLPLGLERIFGVPGHELANRIVPLDQLIGGAARRIFDVLGAMPGDAAMIDMANAFLRAEARASTVRAWRFQRQAEAWLTASDDPQVDQLMQLADVGARQVERLCGQYFGASPKLLARKSRILRAVTRLRLHPTLDWKQAAGSGFYDQPHFIREFKAFTGRTPKVYAAAQAPIMEQSYRQRSESLLVPKLSLLS